MVKKKEFNVFHVKTWKFINTKRKVFENFTVLYINQEIQNMKKIIFKESDKFQ